MKNILVVTGGGRGIGAAVSRLAAARGYAVCVNYRTGTASAETVVREITANGGEAFAVAADVSRQAEVEKLFRMVDDEFGRVTALVNNAGVVAPQGRVDQVDEERLNRLFTTNITSAFLCSKEAVLRMSTVHGGAGGAIVNVSSAASRLGSPGEYVDYAASKGAIDSLTIGLSLEVASEGIRVNGVRPGFIRTTMHADGGDPGRVDRLQHLLPMGRGGEPAEVAEAVLWLLSPAASFVTGSFVDLAGGK